MIWMLEHMPEHCSDRMLGALHVEQCTYVRTYSRTTTHLGNQSHVSNARRGAARFSSIKDETDA